MAVLQELKIVFFFITACLVLFCIVFNHRNLYYRIHKYKKPNDLYKNNDTYCYFEPDKIITLRADNKILVAEKSIIFLETFCKGGLNSRQACAVESACRMNPEWDIYVFIIGPLDIKYQQGLSYSALASCYNLHFVRINVTEFTRGTEVETLYTKNIFKRSEYPMSHHSDALRILALNKYGGLYLDTDVIVIKSFNSLPKNFVAKQEPEALSAGVMRFSKDAVGHNFTTLALRYLKTHSYPDNWGAFGPHVINSVMVELCEMKNITEWSANTCKGIEVFDDEYFYPTEYGKFKTYYHENRLQNNVKAYTHHLWNYLGQYYEVKKKSLFDQLARKYCPLVHDKYGTSFGI